MLTRRQKKCKFCGEKFSPKGSFDKACSALECRVKYGEMIAEKSRKQRERQQKQAKKAERAADREKRESLRTRSDWVRIAQQAFNTFIRLRDKGLPCISCGAPLEEGAIGGGYDCGHFRSVGSAPHLRFGIHAEDNAHAQCKRCNRYGAGRVVEYRVGLIRRIGLSRVEAIEADNTPRKFTVSELKQIAAHYRARVKELGG